MWDLHDFLIWHDKKNEDMWDVFAACVKTTIEITLNYFRGGCLSGLKVKGYVVRYSSLRMFLKFSDKFPVGDIIYFELNYILSFFFNITLFIDSRKYAAHCSLIASRFGLPPFVHPPPVPVKAEGKHCRLRVGYVHKLSFVHWIRKIIQQQNKWPFHATDMWVVILEITPFPISWDQYLECMIVPISRLFYFH